MGTGGSVNTKSNSPHDNLLLRKRRDAMKKRYTDDGVSELYIHCLDQKHDEIKALLSSKNRQELRKLNCVEPNGDTCLHAAVRNKDVQTIKMLVERGFHPNLLDRNGKFAFECMDDVITRRVFARSNDSKRFCESNGDNGIAFYASADRQERSKDEQPMDTLPDDDKLTSENKAKMNSYVETFEDEKELYKYALNQQTTALWLRVYNWVFRNFGGRINHEFLQADSFNLDQNKDFEHFILKGCTDEEERELTREAIIESRDTQSIEPLIKMYTKSNGCFRSLNKQLTNSTYDHDSSPHMCDRFIIEFYIRAEQVEKRAFCKTTYRGAVMSRDILRLYEEILTRKENVIAFKPFTSTSENKMVAFEFLNPQTVLGNDVNVLFVIVVKDKSVNIFGIKDISAYPEEEEVLVMPGTLFRLTKIIHDVDFVTKDHIAFKGIEIHLTYLHIPISNAKKLQHTYRSATNNVL